mmetsp:Transcript_48250/g.43252  ORF Transcript_48250/g.43252 Transcript_48250/m.43252 type:complete len:216 (+) Transcript_48250:2-649(+)
MATTIAAIATSMIADLTHTDKPSSEDDVLTDTEFNIDTSDITNYQLILKKLDQLDKEWSIVIHKMELGLLDFIIAVPGTLFGVIGCPILAIWYYHKYQSWLYPFSCFVVVAINHTAKYIFGRKRPLQSNCGKKLIPLKKMHHDPAMPSGDTAQAAVAAATMIYHGYSYNWAFVIPASAFARVYFGSHYIGDTIVGGIFAWGVTWAINSCFGSTFE